MKKRIVLCIFLAVILMASAACQPAATPTQEASPTEAPKPTEPPAPVDPMAELEAAAKAEGEIVSYGLPDDWVNYGGMWTVYEGKYGIAHLDTDMGSGEIISALQATGGGVADNTELGVNFDSQVVEDELLQAYKHADWDGCLTMQKTRMVYGLRHTGAQSGSV